MNKSLLPPIRFALSCVLFVVLAALAQVSHAAEMENPFAKDPAEANAAAAAGEELFGRNCQQCHNSRGKGGKAPQLVRGAWGPDGANTDTFMYRTITLGRPKTQMGSFALILEPDEVWQVITFLRAEAQRVKAAAKKNTDDDTNW